jgi:hypothetical protein
MKAKDKKELKAKDVITAVFLTAVIVVGLVTLSLELAKSDTSKYKSYYRKED